MTWPACSFGTRRAGGGVQPPTRALQEAAQQGLHLVHRRLHRLRHRAGDPRADGPAAATGSASSSCSPPSALYAGIGIMSRTTDAAEYYVAGRRVPAIYNGMATGADWMSAASFIGMAGTLYLHRLRRPGVHHGLDRRLLPGGAVPGAVPAQVRPVHDPRLPRRALRGQPAALHRHHRRDPVLVHLRGGADLRRGPDHHAAVGPGVRDRDLRRPGRHPGVLVPRRHARGHLDAGGAVHHPDHRLPDSGGLAVGQADRRADPAGDLRLPAREGHRARRRAAQGSEGARGRRDLQGARRRVRRQAEGRAGRAGGRQGGGREEAGRPEGRQRAGGRDPGGREGAGRAAEGRRRRQARPGPRPRRPTRRAPRRSAACRNHAQIFAGDPERRRRRRRRPSTSRGATSWRWSSA